MEDLLNFGFGILGVVICLTVLIVRYFLNKEKGILKPLWKALVTATMILVIYIFIISPFKFIYGGFDKMVFEDLKKIMILVALLISWHQAHLFSKNTTKKTLKFLVKVWGRFAAIFSILILVAMYTSFELLDNSVEIINDIWGIVATLYAAFVIFVLSREANENTV